MSLSLRAPPGDKRRLQSVMEKENAVRSLERDVGGLIGQARTAFARCAIAFMETRTERVAVRDPF